MFMRFRGGGVGHLGTRYLNSRLNEDSHTVADEGGDSYLHNLGEQGDGIEEDVGMHEERTSGREPCNEEGEEDDEEDMDADEDADEDIDEEQEVSGQDLENDSEGHDEEEILDEEILDEEGFAEF